MAHIKSEYMVKRYIAWLLVLTLVGFFLYGCKVRADDLHEDEGYDTPEVLVNIYQKGRVKEVSHGKGFQMSWYTGAGSNRGDWKPKLPSTKTVFIFLVLIIAYSALMAILETA